MPSPIAHSLIGLAVGVAALRPRGEPVADTLRNRSLPLLGCVALANAPDLDFVPGFIAGDMNAFHHGYSHTLVWALGFGLWAWLLVRLFRNRIGWFAFVLMSSLVISHLAADYLCVDNAPPYGIYLFWPLSDAAITSPVSLFQAMEKDDLAQVFHFVNIGAALQELLIGVGFLLLAFVWTRAKATPGVVESVPA